MTATDQTYDLVLLLDTQAEPPARAKIVADTRAAIEAKGALVRHDEWGERALSYPIDRHTSAEYHLLQFHVADDELLGGLDHTLRITDGLLRFRIVKLKPGTPTAPDMRTPGVRRGEGEPAAAESAPAPDAAPVEPSAPEQPAAETPLAEVPPAEQPPAEAPVAETA